MGQSVFCSKRVAVHRDMYVHTDIMHVYQVKRGSGPDELRCELGGAVQMSNNQCLNQHFNIDIALILDAKNRPEQRFTAAEGTLRNVCAHMYNHV